MKLTPAEIYPQLPRKWSSLKTMITTNFYLDTRSVKPGLMAYAMKYAYVFHKTRRQPIRTKTMKPDWAKKRNIGFGLMIIGAGTAIIGCII